MSAIEQTPTKERRDQVTLSPTSKRSLPNASGLPAVCTESRLKDPSAQSGALSSGNCDH